jgi:signal transduction histidine kinase
MAARVPLRIKFLILLLLGVLTVTITALFIVRQAVDRQIRREIFDDLRNSVLTFRAFQREREATLSHSAELLADLPTLKALMTTDDVATIQDASEPTWRLSGGDLLALASPDGKVMAIHASANQVSLVETQEALTLSIGLSANQQWWFLGGHLYEVFFQPIYFGRSKDDRLLGLVALGYEINAGAAKEVSQIAGSQVSFLYGNTVVASTIDRARLSAFEREFQVPSVSQDLAVQDLQLGDERYLASTMELTNSAPPGVRLNVLKSYDQAAARFQGLYRTLAGLGIAALLGQGLLAFVAFRRYTRPLEKLVAGVRALGRGDFTYPLDVHGRDELAEVTESFIRMRDDVQQTQRQLLETERLATIGRMASSISHDLRHQLTPIVANSEFLSERNLAPDQSEDLYQEILAAAGRMTELIDSLLEFGNVQRRLSPTYGSVKETMQRAIRSVQSHPSIHKVNITLLCESNGEGWFDAKKLERSFYNLLLNACQAAPLEGGEVTVKITAVPKGVEITVRDNGQGVPEHLRTEIFEPFASFGKENGTGLGLTIVEKLVGEHGGTVELADPSPGQTTFKVLLPLGSGRESEGQENALQSTSESYTSNKQGL